MLQNKMLMMGEWFKSIQWYKRDIMQQTLEVKDATKKIFHVRLYDRYVFFFQSDMKVISIRNLNPQNM
jgi:hypothetical protein